MGDGDLKIKISTTAELAALRAMEADLQRNIVKLEALKKAGSAVDQVRLDNLKRELASVQGALGDKPFFAKLGAELQGFAEKIPGVGEVMRALNGATGPLSLAFAGVSAAVAGAGKAISEFATAEAAVTKMDAALANMGMLTAANREQFQKLAQQLQTTTGVARDEWYSVLERLIKTGKVEVDQIETHTTAIKNLAGLLGGDVATATHLYTMALQGNFSMLGRHGIVLREAGTATEKLAELQRQAAQRGAGILEASTHTLTGAFRAAGHGVAELTVSIGGWLASILPIKPVLQTLGDSLKYWGEQIGGVIPKIDGLENKLGKATTTFPAAENHFRDLAQFTDGLATATEKSATALERETTALTVATKAAEAKLKAQLALQLAELEARHDISEPQKAVERARLTGASSQQIFDLKQAETQSHITLLEGADGRGGALGELKKTLADAQERLRQQQGNVRLAKGFDDTEADLRAKLLQYKTELAKPDEFTLIEQMAAAEGRPVEERLTDAEKVKYAQTKANRASLPPLIQHTEFRLAMVAAQRADHHLGNAAEEEAAADTLRKQLTGDDGKGGLQADTQKKVEELTKQLTAAKAELAERATVRPLEEKAEQAKLAEDQRKADTAARKQRYEADQKNRETALKNLQEAEPNRQQALEAAKTPAAQRSARQQITAAQKKEIDLLRESVKAEVNELAYQAAESPTDGPLLAAKSAAALAAAAEKINAVTKRFAGESAKTNQEMTGKKDKPAEFPAITGQDLANDPTLFPKMTGPTKPPHRETPEEEKARRIRQGTWVEPSPAAGSADSVPPPPTPIDVSQVTTGISKYFTINLQQHQKTDAEIAVLTSQIAAASTELQNLKGQVRELKNS